MWPTNSNGCNKTMAQMTPREREQVFAEALRRAGKTNSKGK